jgi:ELWxxDGT repeat protein
MFKSLLFVFLNFIVFSANAQVMFAHYDLDPGSGSSHPCEFFNYNGKMLFCATTAASGAELWESDGTHAGTKMFKDLNPGSGSGSPNSFVEMGGKIYFNAYDATHGSELWVSDGTVAGTVMLKDINPGIDGSMLFNLMVYNSKLYFGAIDNVHGFELWVSDGTATGTQLLKDINPLSGHSLVNTPMRIVNGKLLFDADNGSNGMELWVSDGTTAGTQMLKDIWPGITKSLRQGPGTERHVFGNKMFFEANDSVHGIEPWVTDGTAAGTYMLADVMPGTANGGEWTYFAELSGKIYFNADRGGDFWETDGTTTNTKFLFTAIPVTSPAPIEVHSEGFKVYNGKFYYQTYSKPLNLGYELWVSDGTAAGTHIVDIHPGVNGSYAHYLTTYRGHLYFVGINNNTEMTQLFHSDGTIAGTTRITPYMPASHNAFNGTSNKNPFTYHEYNGALYFMASYNSNGMELWSIRDTTTSVAHLENNAGFSLYPNPSNGNFTIEIKTDFKEGSVMVYDMMGRLIKSEKLISKSETISINQPKGIYFVKVQLDDAVSTKKVILE